MRFMRYSFSGPSGISVGWFGSQGIVGVRKLRLGGLKVKAL